MHIFCSGRLAELDWHEGEEYEDGSVRNIRSYPENRGGHVPPALFSASVWLASVLHPKSAGVASDMIDQWEDDEDDEDESVYSNEHLPRHDILRIQPFNLTSDPTDCKNEQGRRPEWVQKR